MTLVKEPYLQNISQLHITHAHFVMLLQLPYHIYFGMSAMITKKSSTDSMLINCKLFHTILSQSYYLWIDIARKLPCASHILVSTVKNFGKPQQCGQTIVKEYMVSFTQDGDQKRVKRSSFIVNGDYQQSIDAKWQLRHYERC